MGEGHLINIFDDTINLFGKIINKLKREKRKRDNNKMDVSKVISKEGLQQKCKEYPNVTCELICLNGDAK